MNSPTRDGLAKADALDGTSDSVLLEVVGAVGFAQAHETEARSCVLRSKRKLTIEQALQPR